MVAGGRLELPTSGL